MDHLGHGVAGIPDGHDELTLIVRPREDSYPPDPDLIVSQPFVPTAEWTVGSGSPSIPAVMSAFYLDKSTGQVYTQDSGQPVGTRYCLMTTDPLDVPEGLTANPGYRLVGLTWQRVAIPNLGRYQVRWAQDDRHGHGRPSPSDWTLITTTATAMVVAELDPAILLVVPGPCGQRQGGLVYERHRLHARV